MDSHELREKYAPDDASACRHEDSLHGRCAACGKTWEQQAAERSTPAARAGGDVIERAAMILCRDGNPPQLGAAMALAAAGLLADPEQRDQLAAKDEEIARLNERVRYWRDSECIAARRLRDQWADRARERMAERDRARGTAAALEAENARLTAKVERVDAVARERDVPWPSKFKFGASDNYLAGFRAANARFRAALSDTTGEAS